MKKSPTIKKSILKQGYYYESKPFYDALPDTLTVPKYQTEIFSKEMTHQEILDTYKITLYKNIQDASAAAADCIPTLKNDYFGRLAYFMHGDNRYRLYVYRDSVGELGVDIYEVSPGNQWPAGRGVVFSNETENLELSDTVALGNLELRICNIEETLKKIKELL